MKENAFKNIKKYCQWRIKELFRQGVPQEVQERYEKELQYLEHSNAIDDFEIYRRISEVADKINIRPTISGSILCYLLGNSYNPLSPYYYCSKCGYYERIEGICYGVDATKKQCPTCGQILEGEGYNIPIESVWGLDGTKTIAIEYEVELDFVRTIKHILESSYPDCMVAYWSGGDDKSIIDGYVIVSKEFETNQHPRVKVQKINGEVHIQGDWSVLEEYMTKYVGIFVNVNQNENKGYVVKNGLYLYQDNQVPEFFWNTVYHTTPEFRDDFLLMLQEFESQTFEEMVAACSSVYNSYAWRQEEKKGLIIDKVKSFISSDVFRRCPCYTREDFYEYLCQSGMERTDALKVVELIRKGAAVIRPERLLVYEIPREVMDIAKNYRYVVSRAYVIQTVYRYQNE